MLLKSGLSSHSEWGTGVGFGSAGVRARFFSVVGEVGDGWLFVRATLLAGVARVGAGASLNCCTVCRPLVMM